MRPRYQLLPPLPPDQYQALENDIAVNGVLVPVVRDEEGQTLDGHHRERIAKNLGLKNYPVRTVSGMSEEQKRHLVLALNCARRNLTTAQKRAIIADELRRAPDLSDRWLASLIGVDNKTVAAVRRELVAREEVPHVKQFRGRDGKRYQFRSIPTENHTDATRAQQVLQELNGQAPVKTLTLERAERLLRYQRLAEAREQPLAVPSPKDRIQIYHCDFRKLDIKKCSVRVVWTDPPFGRENLGLYADLGEFAARVLQPGGVLATYAPKCYLSEIMAFLGKHLAYQWIVALVSEGDVPMVHPKKITVRWRALLLYSKGKFKPGDCLVDIFYGTGKEKEYHEWQQPLNETKYFLERLTRPKDLIVDCFGGGFTTMKVVQELPGRRGVSCDIDRACCVIGQQRLREA